ncbi:hypothetical protein [Streptomyces sp. NPDC006997]|uniref:hypothetical protein n=1 Tax=Streptomyces sp. NPDC006997 TaxID=3155356 RepID=UPI0033CAA95B
MATIRILQAIGGLDFSWQPGDLVDLDDDTATKWADGVRAELADQDPPSVPTVNGPPPPGDHVPPAATDPDNPNATSDQDDEDDAVMFNPADHNVSDVLAYLDGVGEEEAMRVLQVEEAAEQPRKGIVGQRGSILERAQVNDQTHMERTAETSRGGGRGDVIETR